MFWTLGKRVESLSEYFKWHHCLSKSQSVKLCYLRVLYMSCKWRRQPLLCGYWRVNYLEDCKSIFLYLEKRLQQLSWELNQFQPLSEIEWDSRWEAIISCAIVSSNFELDLTIGPISLPTQLSWLSRREHEDWVEELRSIIVWVKPCAIENIISKLWFVHGIWSWKIEKLICLINVWRVKDHQQTKLCEAIRGVKEEMGCKALCYGWSERFIVWSGKPLIMIE